MNELTLFSVLLTQVWQVSVVAMLVWMVARTVGQNRPHLAHALWLLVLLKALTPPVFSSPTSPFCWIDAKEVPARVVEVADASRYANPLSVKVNHGTEPTTSAADSCPKVDSENASTIDPWLLCRRLILTIWISGVLFWLSCWILRYRLFLRWLSRSNETRMPQVDSLIVRLSRQLGIKHSVRVRVLDAPVGPAVLGLLRPTIVLPKSIVGDRTDDQLAPLLAHELVHLRRGDLWWAVVQALSRCLLWFHPFVHLASRHLTSETERSCDEETIAGLGCTPTSYARCLLSVLEQKHQLHVAPALPGVRPVEITSARLERVMSLGQGCHRKSPAWVWLVLLLGCAVLLPGAAIVFAQKPGRAVTDHQVANPDETVGDDGSETAHALKVRVVEIDADSVAQLGINWRDQEEKASSEIEGEDGKAQNRVVIRTTHLPAKTAVLGNEELQNLTSKLGKIDGVKRICSPSLVSQDGCAAEIFVGSEHPFVTHMEKAGEVAADNGKKFVWQPKIEFVMAGTKVRTIPTLQENGELQIDAEFSQSRIESADWVEFSEDASQKVQSPVVTRNLARSTDSLPAGRALVVLVASETGPAEDKLFLYMIERHDMVVAYREFNGMTDQERDPDSELFARRARAIGPDSVAVEVTEKIRANKKFFPQTLMATEVFEFPGAKSDVRQFVIQQVFLVREAANQDKPSGQRSDVAGDVKLPSALNQVTISARKGDRCSIQLPCHCPEKPVVDPTLVNLKQIDASNVEFELLQECETRIEFRQENGQIINVEITATGETDKGQFLPQIK